LNKCHACVPLRSKCSWINSDEEILLTRSLNSSLKAGTCAQLMSILYVSSKHCKKTGQKIKRCLEFLSHGQFFFISAIQKLCSSPLSCFKITQVGKKTLMLLMETNPIPRSKKYFRCICLNSVGTAESVGKIFSTPPPPAHKASKLYWNVK
jgi:hypothetical protein